jgi:hypothetical protein
VCFWLKTKWWWCPITPTHPTALLATFFVPTDKAGFEREAFANIAEIQRESLMALDSISVEYFRQCFHALGELQGSLHPVTGTVLWSGIQFQTCMNILSKFL